MYAVGDVSDGVVVHVQFLQTLSVLNQLGRNLQQTILGDICKRGQK